MKALITLIVMVFTVVSEATVIVGSGECPTSFEGKAAEIIRPVGATNAFSMNKVVFENQRTLKGEVDDQVLLDVLQNGPFEVETDKEYRVHLRNGKLCWMEEI